MDRIDWAFSRPYPQGQRLLLLYMVRHATTEGLCRLNLPRYTEQIGHEHKTSKAQLRSLQDAGAVVPLGNDWWSIGPDHNLAGLPLGAMTDVRGAIHQALRDEIASIRAGAAAPARLRLPPDGSNNHRVPIAPGARAPIDDSEIDEEQFRKAVDFLDAQPVPTEGRMVWPTDEHQAAAVDDDDQEQPIARTRRRPKASLDPTKTPYAAELQSMFALLGHSGLPVAEIEYLWTRLVEAESKHDVPGEAPAFTLLWPAIKSAALALRHQMTAREFLEAALDPLRPDPWSMDARDPAADAGMEADIAAWERELGAANHPHCQPAPRTVEINEDTGARLQEPLAAYHHRLRGQVNQLRKLRSMDL